MNSADRVSVKSITNFCVGILVTEKWIDLRQSCQHNDDILYVARTKTISPLSSLYWTESAKLCTKWKGIKSSAKFPFQINASKHSYATGLNDGPRHTLREINLLSPDIRYAEILIRNRKSGAMEDHFPYHMCILS